MFIPRKIKKLKGQTYQQHQLLRSERTIKGPRQEVVLNMGELKLPQQQRKALANAIEAKLNNQSAFAFDLRGGEAGAAHVTVMSRDGAVIDTVPVEPTGEFDVGFLRAQGKADIAGFILTNTDPQGLAIDRLRFGKPPDLS